GSLEGTHRLAIDVLPHAWFECPFHYCPEFSERTAVKYLIYNGFPAIFGGVDLNLLVVSRSVFLGGPTDVRRQDAFLAADGLPALEHIYAARRAIPWRLLGSNTAVCRAVPSHGLRPTDLPGEPSRH